MAFKISNIEIKNRVVLAPMAGFCDNAFRSICKEMGAGLIYTEMVSNKAVAEQNKNTLKMLYMKQMEKPLAVQIFGTDQESFVTAAKYIEDNTVCDFLDINLGCPMPKVATKLQAGAGLLKNPELIYEILVDIVKNVTKPVTVKMRMGWDDKSVNAIEVSKLCEKAGVSAIAIHGRTREQMYRGVANWDIIKQVKEIVNIPIIGNGDVDSPQKAKEMLDYTGCDAVMIGRATRGNPWIFTQTIEFLNTGKIKTIPTPLDKIKMLKEHFSRLLKLKGVHISVYEVRKHAIFYLQGINDSKEFRQKLNKITNPDKIFILIDDFIDSYRQSSK